MFASMHAARSRVSGRSNASLLSIFLILRTFVPVPVEDSTFVLAPLEDSNSVRFSGSGRFSGPKNPRRQLKKLHSLSDCLQ
ncbi:hypothetical protein [Methanosarcina barkeri]|uniref:hypothetical protein n=1 Tax=Methanosarcina barkeri TaxID=2208 RepID=UPI000B202E77|nr:hypothetical protein [Methanosarcina barkeri]